MILIGDQISRVIAAIAANFDKALVVLADHTAGLQRIERRQIGGLRRLPLL